MGDRGRRDELADPVAEGGEGDAGERALTRAEQDIGEHEVHLVDELSSSVWFVPEV